MPSSELRVRHATARVHHDHWRCGGDVATRHARATSCRRGDRMKRRKFIVGAGAALVWPLTTLAQQTAMPVVGVLRADTPAAGANVVAAFRKGLSEMSFVEGRNVTIEL